MASKGIDALFHASSECKLRLVRLLIEGGISVNTRNEEQQTSIMLACKSNNTNEDKGKVVHFLLNMNAKVNLRDVNGKTALIFACLSNSNSNVISSLVNASAHPCIQDNEKKSALDYAKKRGNLITIKLLLDAIQKQDQILERASDVTKMRDSAECLSAIQDTRKLSWPLMSNFRRILTPRQRYELSDFKTQNKNPSQNVLAANTDKHKVRECNATRKRKHSICHFGPINLETIMNECEEGTSIEVPLAEARRSNDQEHQLSTMQSIPRISSVDDKISLNFSEDESDEFPYLQPCTKQPQSQITIKVNSLFSSSLSHSSKDVTDTDPDTYSRVICIKDTKETSLTHDSNKKKSNAVVNETKRFNIRSSSDATSKSHWVQQPLNSMLVLNTASSTTNDYYRRCRKTDSLVINEGKHVDDLKKSLGPTGAVQPCAGKYFLQESPKVRQMFHPSSQLSTRRNFLTICNCEPNAAPNIFPGTSNCSAANASISVRRHTTSSLLEHPSISSQTKYGSDSDLLGLSRGSGTNIQTERRKLSPSRITFKRDLSILDTDSNQPSTPLPDGGLTTWLQTAEKEYQRRNSDVDLPFKVQLPGLSKRLNKVSLDNKVQNIGNQSNHKESNVLSINLYLHEDAQPKRKGSNDIPHGRHSILQTNDHAKQCSCSQEQATLNSQVIKQLPFSPVYTSECDVKSTETTGYNWKADSVNCKPNPLPDLLPHSVLQATRSPKTLSQPSSKSTKNDFIITCQETTKKESSTQMVNKYSLTELVCATTAGKITHVPVLPPLCNNTTTRSNNE